MVPALFITVDKDNESGNKTGRKLRELSFFLGKRSPSVLSDCGSTHTLMRTHTNAYTAPSGSTGERGWKGRSRGRQDAARNAALHSPTAWWPAREVKYSLCFPSCKVNAPLTGSL